VVALTPYTYYRNNLNIDIMEIGHVTQDYYGMKYYSEENKATELIIFVVDDNKVYLKLFRQNLEQYNYTVHAFSSGEEALEYSYLQPDIVFMDYHLDGINPYAKKGDEIAREFKLKSPDSDVVMISSDEKFKILQDLNFLGDRNVFYKDRHVLQNLSVVSSEILTSRFNDETRKYRQLRNVIFGVMTVLSSILLYMVL